MFQEHQTGDDDEQWQTPDGFEEPCKPYNGAVQPDTKATTLFPNARDDNCVIDKYLDQAYPHYFKHAEQCTHDIEPFLKPQHTKRKSTRNATGCVCAILLPMNIQMCVWSFVGWLASLRIRLFFTLLVSFACSFVFAVYWVIPCRLARLASALLARRARAQCGA